MKSKLAIFIVSFVCLAYSCKKDDQTLQMPTYAISHEEIDGVSYKCITIGDQLWMAENLKTRLDGGRADGAMTFNEPFVTFESKESLDLKRTVKEKLLKRWEEGIFNTDAAANDAAIFFIEDDLIGYFFNSNAQSWAQYYTYNAPYWGWWYDAEVAEIVAKEVTRLFEEEKKLILLAAADQDYLQTHGNLYTFEASKKVVPEGWRIPSDEDWMKLEKALGMSDQDIQRKDEWRGNIGSFLKTNPVEDNFNATLGGAYIYGTSENSNANFKNNGLRGYWWTSTKDETAVDSTYYIRSLRFDNDQMLRGTTRIHAANTIVGPPAYSIRLVKNK